MFERECGKRPGRHCDEPGCSRTVGDGPLWRVNAKGQPGIFKCSEHAWPTHREFPSCNT